MPPEFTMTRSHISGQAIVTNRSPTHDMLFSVLSWIPSSLYRSSNHTPLLVPFYHLISDEDIAHTKHLYRHKSIKAFKKDLDFLLGAYSPITLRDVLECQKADRPLPNKSFLLTFDDGYREISDVVAPILLAKGVSATFFLNSAFVDNRQLCHVNKVSLLVECLQRIQSSRTQEKLLGLLRTEHIHGNDLATATRHIRYDQRAVLDEMASILGTEFSSYLVKRQPYLTSSQIRQLIIQGFTIGGHSVDHSPYSSLGLEAQLHQTIESVRFVREQFGLNYGAFAFPFDDEGVSNGFFEELSRESSVDVTFGAAGLIDDGIPHHYQRVCMELRGASAKRIIAYHHARRLMKPCIVTNGSR